MTSGTSSVGRFATFSIGIFGNMIELVMFTRWLSIGLCATGGTSGSASCVEFPQSDSTQVVLQTEPSVKGCNLSGKESPPAFAGVDWCLATATTGTWFSDLDSPVIPSVVGDGCFPVFQEYGRM